MIFENYNKGIWGPESLAKFIMKILIPFVGVNLGAGENLDSQTNANILT